MCIADDKEVTDAKSVPAVEPLQEHVGGLGLDLNEDLEEEEEEEDEDNTSVLECN
eukprot:gene5927-7131_t